MLSRERERWQTKSDGEGTSAAEAKWILRAKRVKDEREVLLFDCFTGSSVLCVIDLYRLGFASLSEPLSPQGKARIITMFKNVVIFEI